MWTYIIAGVAVLLILYCIATYNKLVQLRNLVKEAFSTMDVYLKLRWDLIPNLVETVKGYAKHEQSTLSQIVGLRSNAYDSMSPEEKLEANTQMSGGLSRLMAIAEAYPDLKANQNFMDLSSQLSRIEADIANARKYYNATVRNFNNKVQLFPGSLVAGIFGFKQAQMFETAAAERENVQVKF